MLPVFPAGPQWICHRLIITVKRPFLFHLPTKTHIQCKNNPKTILHLNPCSAIMASTTSILQSFQTLCQHSVYPLASVQLSWNSAFKKRTQIVLSEFHYLWSGLRSMWAVVQQGSKCKERRGCTTRVNTTVSNYQLCQTVLFLLLPENLWWSLDPSHHVMMWLIWCVCVCACVLLSYKEAGVWGWGASAVSFLLLASLLFWGPSSIGWAYIRQGLCTRWGVMTNNEWFVLRKTYDLIYSFTCTQSSFSATSSSLPLP